MKYISYSEKNTKRFAQNFAKNPKNNIIALTGKLGAGKTTFTQGFAKSLGIKDKIISPTFVLIKQYKIPNSKKVFFHIDLYRLENIKDLNKLGLEEIFASQDNVILIEWAEKVQELLPKNVTKIHIEKKSEQTRLITVSYPF